ncbi:MAG: phenylalanine--tRNA ligase subunit beta [Acidaminococcaceae bacterium]|nr:phenylalanine--tRNA ligase subunit beta [Acidaminococcaceae bacterium]
MLASLEWLKQYVDINIPVAELVDRITRAGLEVETVKDLGAGVSGVLTGKVMEIYRHPDSDHLWVCMMDYGQGIVQILTGAQNVKQYDMVPVATVGATLPPSGHNPDGLKLKKAKMRGLDSFGMLCSADELGIDSKLLLPEERNGIFILPPDTPIGVDVKKILGLDDIVIDIDLTSNRADCFSMIGLAREIAAITGCPMRMPELEVKEAAGGDIRELAAIRIEAEDLCPRFAARMLKNIKIGPSPDWMKKRLRACGMRPISNVVDVTNYVMLELGQPMHAYDYDKVEDHTLVVRRGGKGEKLVTLDEKERVLDDSMIVIADGKRAVGLGGVMGGLDTEVTSATRNVLLEAASFNGPSIRRTSRALGLRSEASGRFERGVDTILTHNALNRAAHLLEEMGACETVSGIVESYPKEVKPAVINTTAQVISGRIGMDIPVGEMVRILRGLQFQVEENNGNLKIVAPSWRNDVTEAADISEEVARIHGLDYIESHYPALGMAQGRQSETDDVKDLVQDYLAGAGLDEVMTYSFINENTFDKVAVPAEDGRRKVIPLINPITDDFKVMRTMLFPSLLSIANYNLARQAERVAIFETGRVYLPQELPLENFPAEPMRIALVLSGRNRDLSWCCKCGCVDFFDVKGLAEGLLEHLGVEGYTFIRSEEVYLHPGKSCDVVLNGEKIGSFGQLHPSVSGAYDLQEESFVLEMELAPLVQFATRIPKYSHMPKFPGMQRDISVVVPAGVTDAELETVIRKHGGELLKDVVVFDLFTSDKIGADKKSLAFKLYYQAEDRTLTDGEVDASMKQILAKVAEEYEGKLRE